MVETINTPIAASGGADRTHTMFAKLRAMLRKVAERSVDGVIKAIGHIIDTIAPDECRNYLKNSGYVST